MQTKVAIAVETFKHPINSSDYRIWYLKLNSFKEVVGIGVMSKKELIQDLFSNYREKGRSFWKAFTKDSERPRDIEVFDFICMNLTENTHFGNLPTLSEFQHVIDSMQLNLELKPVA